ncbi:restriction endonuclease [Candidatus Minimicrobia naudis]|uniref:Restriction endonuclease n=1 Tax=Candidatus Minimicrobia naudis TaxID=2841263 RepID=A0A8F1MCD3_9BACT|nr:restriction endonuclease [Candidatus Minimicrobia naudis]
MFHYKKRYITAYRELEELSQKKTTAADTQSTKKPTSEKAQATNKQPITENRSNPVTPLSDHELLTKIRSMSPYDFEKYIAQLFEHFGYSAATTPYKRDGGIDIVLYKNGVQSYVQCKKYIKKIVKVSEMRDFYGAVVDHLHGGEAFFVTTNIFSSDARKFVKYSTNGNKIRLIDNTGLLTIIRALEDKASHKTNCFPTNQTQPINNETRPTLSKTQPRRPAEKTQQKESYTHVSTHNMLERTTKC